MTATFITPADLVTILTVPAKTFRLPRDHGPKLEFTGWRLGEARTEAVPRRLRAYFDKDALVFYSGVKRTRHDARPSYSVDTLRANPLSASGPAFMFEALRPVFESEPELFKLPTDRGPLVFDGWRIADFFVSYNGSSTRTRLYIDENGKLIAGTKRKDSPDARPVYTAREVQIGDVPSVMVPSALASAMQTVRYDR